VGVRAGRHHLSNDQQVRLVFLGEAGQALLASNQVTTGVRKLSAAQREQAATSRTVAAESGRAAAGMRTLDRDVGKASRGALAGSGVFRGLGRSVAFASTSFLGAYGLLAAVRGSVDEMIMAAKVGAQTRQVILTTGGAAGLTATQFDRLAVATMRKTGIDDEAIKTAENMLATFTEVRNEVGAGNQIFTEATRVVVDMSVALGQDLRSTAIQVGKALQDPITGLTALRRVGVSFTAEQRDQIRALTESGQIVQAQKIVIAELGKEFGGTAAKVNAASGGIGTLREELRNLGGTYAKALSPEIRDATKAAQHWVDDLQQDKAKREEFRHDVVEIAHAVRDVAHVVKEASDAVGGMKNLLEILLALKVANTLSGWTGGFRLLAGAGGIGGAETAAGGLLGTLTKLRLLGPIAIGIEVVIHRKAVGDAIGNFVADATGSKALGDAVSAYERTVIGLIGDPGGTVVDLLGLKGGKGKPSAGGAGVGKPSDIQPGAGGLTKQQKGIVSTAKSRLGQPYVWGGTSWDLGMDCSGFTQQVMARNGISIPRTSQQQAAGGVAVSMDELIPGDLVFSEGWPHPGHVAVYVGGGQVIEDPHTGAGVRYTSVGNFQHARRYLKVVPIPGGSTSGGKGGAGLTPVGPSAPGRTPPPRHRRGPTQQQVLELALAQAGVTPGAADDRAALRALIAYTQRQVKPGTPITRQIELLQQEATYQAQLDALTPKGKKPSKASAAALVNIHHLLDAVTKAVDQAGLDKRFDPQLDKINDELSKKFVTSATLARIRNQLGDISKAVAKELAKAKAAVAANKKAFADQWASLASDAFAAFDKETAAHVSPSRALLNALVDEHDAAARQKALADAQAQLQQALAGKTGDTSGQLDQIRQLVGQAALANSLDKAQSQVLGIQPQEIGSGALINQLQQLLVTQLVPDMQEVASAQQAVDDAQYNIRVADLGKQADAEDSAYADARAALRTALELNLEAWNTYYQAIGEKASKAAGDFATVWGNVLAQFPVAAGGTSTAPDFQTLSPGFNIPSGVIGAGFGGAFAGGGEGVALSPTLFLAGEAGPERYRFTPMRGGMDSSTGGGGQPITIELHGDLALADRVHAIVKDDPRISQTISVGIGQRADALRRGNRV
jgi:hypothetical protein